MKERVVEILVFLMSEIEANKQLSEINLEELKDKGYTQSEISAAFSWLYDNMPMQDGIIVQGLTPSRASHRVLHEAEKLMLTTEAHGYLMQLCELGLLENRDMESVIERAMVSGYEKLSLDEIREIVAAVLFARPSSSHGNRFTQNNNDTVH